MRCAGWSGTLRQTRLRFTSDRNTDSSLVRVSVVTGSQGAGPQTTESCRAGLVLSRQLAVSGAPGNI